MKRLSVIIPMYNVEPFVERCLLSLERQDIPRKEYEIICINDGSPDNSKGIVSKMQKEYDNIILIDQQNQGVSRARNNGIDKASGEYLMFIDPDDYVAGKSFDRILRSVKNKEAQVSFLGFTFRKTDGTIRNRILNEEQAGLVYEGIEAYHLARGDGRTDPDRMVGVLFETAFLEKHKLRYPTEVPYLEDGEFIARILCLAERCIFDAYSFYQRTTRPGSATNSTLFYSEKATRGFLLAAISLKCFQQEHELTYKQFIFLNQPIAKFVILVVNSCIGKSLFHRIRSIKTEFAQNGLKSCNLEGCNRLYRRLGWIYNISPILLIAVLYCRPRLEKVFKRKSHESSGS